MPRYFDGTAHQSCDPLWTPEGLVRCVPSALIDPPSYGAIYADAACTNQAYFCASPSGCDGAAIVTTDGTDRNDTHAIGVNSSVSVPHPYTFAPDGVTCQQDPNAWIGLFAKGDPLPWDMFEALTEVNGQPASPSSGM
jgi:hypothetical protein